MWRAATSTSVHPHLLGFVFKFRIWNLSESHPPCDCAAANEERVAVRTELHLSRSEQSRATVGETTTCRRTTRDNTARCSARLWPVRWGGWHKSSLYWGWCAGKLASDWTGSRRWRRCSPGRHRAPLLAGNWFQPECPPAGSLRRDGLSGRYENDAWGHL